MAGFSGIGSLDGNTMIWAVTAALFAIHLHLRHAGYEALVRKTSPWITGAVFGIILFLCYLSSGNPDAFIYFQF